MKGAVKVNGVRYEEERIAYLMNSVVEVAGTPLAKMRLVLGQVIKLVGLASE